MRESTFRLTDRFSKVGFGWSFAPAFPIRASRPSGKSFVASAAAFLIDSIFPKSRLKTASLSFGYLLASACSSEALVGLRAVAMTKFWGFLSCEIKLFVFRGHLRRNLQVQ